MSIILSDFDKTLTNYDTATDFFIFSAKRNSKKKYLLFLPVFKLLSKFKIISVRKEKELSLYFFCGNNYEQFLETCYEFSETIGLNEMFNFVVCKRNNNDILIIQSASFFDYLKHIVDCDLLIATTLKVRNGKIFGIEDHPYGVEKYLSLIKNGIKEVDYFYYDSKSDESVLPISKLWYKIKFGKIISTNDENTNI